jgi:mRNA interferase MazF
VIYVPLTTQYRNSEYEVVLPNLKFLNQLSIANVQGIASIPTARLERKLGDLPSDVMLQIKKAIIFALDLSL